MTNPTLTLTLTLSLASLPAEDRFCLILERALPVAALALRLHPDRVVFRSPEGETYSIRRKDLHEIRAGACPEVEAVTLDEGAPTRIVGQAHGRLGRSRARAQNPPAPAPSSRPADTSDPRRSPSGANPQAWPQAPPVRYKLPAKTTQGL